MNTKQNARAIALGGVLAALAMVIQSLGTLIPIATFACPMLCMILQGVVLEKCGKRVAWAWYGVVSILSLLMAPDKEAAALFVFLGYYPILKPRIDRMRFSWFWKLLLFQVAIGVMYALLIFVFGMTGIGEEFKELGLALGIVMLIMGNITFLLLDRVLLMIRIQIHRKHKK